MLNSISRFKKYVPVTFLRVPVTISRKVPVTFFFFARDNFQQSARDTEKVPVTNFKIKMSRPLLNVTGKNDTGYEKVTSNGKVYYGIGGLK